MDCGCKALSLHLSLYFLSFSFSLSLSLSLSLNAMVLVCASTCVTAPYQTLSRSSHWPVCASVPSVPAPIVAQSDVPCANLVRFITPCINIILNEVASRILEMNFSKQTLKNFPNAFDRCWPAIASLSQLV